MFCSFDKIVISLYKIEKYFWYGIYKSFDRCFVAP